MNEPVVWLRYSRIENKVTGVLLDPNVELKSEILIPLYNEDIDQILAVIMGDQE